MLHKKAELTALTILRLEVAEVKTKIDAGLDTIHIVWGDRGIGKSNAGRIVAKEFPYAYYVPLQELEEHYSVSAFYRLMVEATGNEACWSAKANLEELKKLALLPHLREEVKTHGLWIYIDGDVEVYFEGFPFTDHFGETFYYSPQQSEEILDLLDSIETWAEYDGDPKISLEWVNPKDFVQFRLAIAPDCEGFAFRKTYKNHDALVAVALSERNLEELVEAVI